MTTPKRRSMRVLCAALVTAFMAVALLGGCARDCDTLVERRCRSLGVESAACATLKERAAAVPHQSCEAVLNALDLQNKAR